MGVNFVFEKMPNWGGPGGGLAKDHTFSVFFLCTLPLLREEAFISSVSEIAACTKCTNALHSNFAQKGLFLQKFKILS